MFGHRALQLWLRLKSDPYVVTYCERPLVAREASGDRAADFWVYADEQNSCVSCCVGRRRRWLPEGTIYILPSRRGAGRIR